MQKRTFILFAFLSYACTIRCPRICLKTVFIRKYEALRRFHDLCCCRRDHHSMMRLKQDPLSEDHFCANCAGRNMRASARSGFHSQFPRRTDSTGEWDGCLTRGDSGRGRRLTGLRLQKASDLRNGEKGHKKQLFVAKRVCKNLESRNTLIVISYRESWSHITPSMPYHQNQLRPSIIYA